MQNVKNACFFFLFICATTLAQSGKIENQLHFLADYDANTRLVTDRMTGWTAQMPKEPFAKDVSASTRGMKRHAYLCQETTSSFSLMCWQIPEQMLEAEKQALAKALEGKSEEEKKKIPEYPFGMLLKVSGLRPTSKLLHNEPIKKKTLVGLEQVVVDKQVKIGGSKFPQVVTYRRIMIHENTLAVISATMSKNAFQEDTQKSKRAMIAFLDSCIHESQLKKDE